MTAIAQNFTVWQTTDKTVTVTLTNSDGDPYGSTSGLTFTWEVFSNDASTTALITKVSASGITNGTSEITIAIADTDTSSLSPGPYYHECRVVDGSSDADVVFIGTMSLQVSAIA